MLNDLALKKQEEKEEDKLEHRKFVTRVFMLPSHDCTDNPNCPICANKDFDNPPVGTYRPQFEKFKKK